MPRKDPPPVVQPAFPPARALVAFKRQLEGLDKFAGRHVDEASAEEDEWEHFTQSLVERTFGNPSSNLNKFYSARNAGVHMVMAPDNLRQMNFNERIQAYGSLLRSIIAEIELDIPEEDIKGVYEPGDEYGFYRDLSGIVSAAKREVFVVDAYIDESVFNLYVDKIPGTVPVRMLSQELKANVHTIAAMYANSKPLALRTSAAFHDRLIFVDDRGWVVGQSIKDAATKKPTYLIELEEPSLAVLLDLHNNVWNTATVVV